MWEKDNEIPFTFWYVSKEVYVFKAEKNEKWDLSKSPFNDIDKIGSFDKLSDLKNWVEEKREPDELSIRAIRLFSKLKRTETNDSL